MQSLFIRTEKLHQVMAKDGKIGTVRTESLRPQTQSSESSQFPEFHSLVKQKAEAIDESLLPREQLVEVQRQDDFEYLKALAEKDKQDKEAELLRRAKENKEFQKAREDFEKRSEPVVLTDGLLAPAQGKPKFRKPKHLKLKLAPKSEGPKKG